MKYLAVLGLFLVVATATVAQTNGPVVGPVAPPPTLQGGAQEIWDAVTDGDTNWVGTTFFIYAPKAEKNKQFGGGAAILHKVNGSNNLLVGPRVDYINGGFEMVSGNVTLQLPIHPIKSLDWLEVTPFAYAGVGLPFGSKTTQLTGIGGVGGAVEFHPSGPGRWHFGLVGDIEKWTSISGNEYRIGPYARFDF